MEAPDTGRTGRRQRDQLMALAFPVLFTACGWGVVKGIDAVQSVAHAVDQLTTQVAVLENRIASLEGRKCR